MQSSTLQPGTVIKSPASEYKIEKVLGAGGFGITYLATGKFKVGNVPVEVKFAIKEHFMETCFRDGDGVTVRCTPTSQLSVEQSRKDFFNEAKRLQAICQLSDHIVNVNETFEANGTAYYVMEYLDGGSPGKMDEPEAISLILQIADAVNALHNNKLLHLDIKPDNIILKNNGGHNQTPVLIDFGLAKHFDKKGNPTSTPNAKGLTNGYAPIEQGGDIYEFAPTLDIYALGATLLYLLTGKNPPSSTYLVDANQSKLKSLIPDNVSESTRNAILHAMKPNKEERTQDIATFINELTQGREEIRKPQSESGGKTESINTKKLKLSRNGKSSKKKYILLGLGLVVLAPIVLFIIYSIKDSIDYEKLIKEIEAQNKIVDELNEAFSNDDYNASIELANQIPDNHRAQYILGVIYSYGLGVEPDINKGIDYLIKATDNVNTDAMLNLGWLYENGEFGIQNYNEALKWYQKAADLQDANAMFRLGNMYEHGIGVPVDYEEAKKWFQKAADMGLEEAQEHLDNL